MGSALFFRSQLACPGILKNKSSGDKAVCSSEDNSVWLPNMLLGLKSLFGRSLPILEEHLNFGVVNYELDSRSQGIIAIIITIVPF